MRTLFLQNSILIDNVGNLILNLLNYSFFDLVLFLWSENLRLSQQEWKYDHNTVKSSKFFFQFKWLFHAPCFIRVSHNPQLHLYLKKKKQQAIGYLKQKVWTSVSNKDRTFSIVSSSETNISFLTRSVNQLRRPIIWDVECNAPTD